MESSYAVPVKPPPQRAPGLARRLYRTVGDTLPGLVAAAMLALPATWLGTLVPTVGGPVLGIVVGVGTGVVLRRVMAPAVTERLRPGFATAARTVLQASIVVLGTGLPLSEVLRVGAGSLPVMLGTLAVALSGAWFVGRLLDIHPESRLLIGVGTGICGASAIAAVTSVVKATEARVAYAMGTIFTFNVAAVLLYPSLGHLLGLSQQAFGLWSGTAVNDTSSVVAAAYAYGTPAGSYAVVVKLTRSLMIVPICVVLQVWQSRRRRAGRRESHDGGTAWRTFPLFIVGFLAASATATLGVVPGSWHPALSTAGTFMITTSLTGIGLSLNPSQIRDAGPRPLLLGAALWVGVGATSLSLQALTGQL
ncbi:putative sulfate exporter family transporter [Streptomyces sp. Li-HN-5-11]|uniref:YeiH family protein n=1 Tax=Streptomyces sp. Li-HN-5-11 TaxID=3075432 RepID=UPI0028AFC7BD|nr:putative sulfate exporter family transporter [Streptomyces sp. Li-HN-5-11]WNM32541.1 putative sulfate exporter family transporter [Streptomyces sp. Li-HN-5-11]WOP38709.1 putative sulfate exporter family transporter [Streptomyces sp. Li-HN-5-13]